MNNYFKSIASVLLSLLLFSTPVFSSSALLVTDLGSSAEYIGVGGNEAVSLGAHNVFHNPSLMGQDKNFSVSLFTTTLMDDIQYRSLALSKQWDKLSVGFGYMDSAVDNITETVQGETKFEVSGYYESQFSVYKGGLSYQLAPHLSMGFVANYYHNKIHSVAGSTLNGDVGIAYRKDHILVSASSKNIFQTNEILYDNDATEALSLVSTLSAHIYAPVVEPMFQMQIHSAKAPSYSVGAIFNLPLISMLDILVGYKTAYHLDTLKNRLTFGFGLNVQDIRFNFTYEKSNSVAFDHNSYFSLTYQF